jgi:hypothetical protein
MVGAALLAGPLPAAEAGPTTSAPAPGLVEEAAGSTGLAELAEALSVEYTGAVPAGQVAATVHGVASQLRADAPAPALLLRTTEAASRRALTDHLARGVPLPA